MIRYARTDSRSGSVSTADPLPLAVSVIEFSQVGVVCGQFGVVALVVKPACCNGAGRAGGELILAVTGQPSRMRLMDLRSAGMAPLVNDGLDPEHNAKDYENRPLEGIGPAQSVAVLSSVKLPVAEPQHAPGGKDRECMPGEPPWRNQEAPP